MSGIEANARTFFFDKMNEIEKYIGTVSKKIETKYIEMGNWLDQHPTVYKIAVVAMHLIRAISMAALMSVMPFHPLLNFSISLIASEIYRIVIERHCAFKFAELSCLGGEALLISQYSIQQLIHSTAMETFKHVSFSLLGVVPLALYLGTVIMISIKNVNEKLADPESFCNKQVLVKPTCCTPKPIV